MVYEIGKYYSLHFEEEVIGADGNKYLRVSDNEGNKFTVRPFSYQADWSDITTELECFVSSVDIYGRPRFQLSREAALKYWYEGKIGHYQTFFVERRGTDPNTNADYLIVSDCYGIEQRFYPNDDKFIDKCTVGQDIILEVLGIVPSPEGKNNARLNLAIHKEVDINLNDNGGSSSMTDFVVQDSSNGEVPESEVIVIRDPNEFYVGEEDTHTEFKLSIAYPAGGNGADINKQLGIIVRSLAGFMNKDGGVLYVGVNDAGVPTRDISLDYPFLNDDDKDNFTYREENFDQYKLKIINKVSYLLGQYAASLISIEKLEYGDIEYAAIKVEKAGFPIWYDKTELYVRCDNSTRRMLGDAITVYVNLFGANAIDLINAKTVEIEDENTNNSIIDIEKKKLPKSKVQTCSIGEAWHYIAFYDNGEWAFRRSKYERKPDDLVCEVAIPKNPKQYQLVVAYESGNANGTHLKSVLYGSGKKCNTLIGFDSRRKNGLNLEVGKVVAAFCLKAKEDLLLVESEVNNVVRVKVHTANVVTYRNSFSAQGVHLIPTDGGKLLNLASISKDSGYRPSIEGMGITVKDANKYRQNGVTKAHLMGKYQQLIDDVFDSQELSDNCQVQNIV